jgi:hypothetical protein
MADPTGFDCSQWQNGEYAGGGGFAFGIAKLTEGVGYKDPAADRHMAAILRQAIIPGGYHFARPDLNGGVSGAYAEADWFWTVATSYGGARGMLLGQDAESAGGSAAWCDAFTGRLAWRLGGYLAPFYSYWSWMTTRGIVGSAVLQRSALWLAWPDSNGALPRLSVSIQQYGLTSVPGLVGQVDANRFFGTIADLRALTVGAGVAPVAATATTSDSSEGSMVILRHPAAPERLDHIWIDTDGIVQVHYSLGGAGGLDSGDNDSAEHGHGDFGSPPGGAAPGSLAACWDHNNALCVTAADAAGTRYLYVRDWTGKLVQDWSVMPYGAVGLPGKGKKGDPGPDVRPDIAAALEAAVAVLQNG